MFLLEILCLTVMYTLWLFAYLPVFILTWDAKLSSSSFNDQTFTVGTWSYCKMVAYTACTYNCIFFFLPPQYINILVTKELLCVSCSLNICDTLVSLPCDTQSSFISLLVRVPSWVNKYAPFKHDCQHPFLAVLMKMLASVGVRQISSLPCPMPIWTCIFTSIWKICRQLSSFVLVPNLQEQSTRSNPYINILITSTYKEILLVGD